MSRAPWPLYGVRLLNSIQVLKRAAILAREHGHGVELLLGVREWIAQNYIVHYLVLKDNLIILQIWHGREDRTNDE